MLQITIYAFILGLLGFIYSVTGSDPSTLITGSFILLGMARLKDKDSE